MKGIKTVHANGRIVYEAQEREDEWLGSTDELGVREGVRRLAELERKKEGLEERMGAGGEDDDEIEAELDEVLDEILALETGGATGGEDDDDDDDGDDDDDDHEEEEEEEEEEGPERKRSRTTQAREDPPNFSTVRSPPPEHAVIKLSPGDCLYLPGEGREGPDLRRDGAA